MQNRVCCLYRVSTDKQVNYDDKHNADIPMQRKECHRFAEAHGWTIVMEEQEEGVSGHKVRAANRDKLQLIREAAVQKKFDILLVFMFDRIGRIADETPFVVEWFVKNGIQVWSTQEGEQRFDGRCSGNLLDRSAGLLCHRLHLYVQTELFHRRKELGYLQIFGVKKGRIAGCVLSEYLISILAALAGTIAFFGLFYLCYRILGGVWLALDIPFVSALVALLGMAYLLTAGISVSISLRKPILKLIQ